MFKAAALALLLTSGAALGQNTAERLNRLIDDIVLLPGNNCRPTEAEIASVIDGLIATLPIAGRTRGRLIADPVHSNGQPAADDSTASAMRALGYLVQFPNWRAENHDDAVMRLRAATGAAAGRHVQDAAARALAFGRGGLVPLVMAHQGDATVRFAAIRAFIAAEDGADGNPFLAAIARLTLAEGLQEEAYGQRPLSSVPWAPPAEAATTSPTEPFAQTPPAMLAEATALYHEVRAFYDGLRDDPTWSTRDPTLDFDYLLALLDYVNGGEDWKALLGTIIEVEGAKDHYQLAADRVAPRHIYVQNFLRLPPSIVVPAEVAQAAAGQSMDSLPTTCPTPEEVTAAGALQVDPATGLGINRFFNAPLLAHHTCNILESWQGGDAPALARALARHVNADYRIVLGHYRGDEVRFSFMSRKDLMAVAEKTAGDPAMTTHYEPRPAPAATEACPWPDSAATQFAPSLQAGDQPTGGDSGYIYIGNGLTWTQGNQLLEQITRRGGRASDFSGAYLIRPLIE